MAGLADPCLAYPQLLAWHHKGPCQCRERCLPGVEAGGSEPSPQAGFCSDSGPPRVPDLRTFC